MHDTRGVSRDPLVLLVTGFLLTTVLGGGLTFGFQRANWRHQYRAQREDLLHEQALKTFEEISKGLDRRLYRMRRVYWAAKAKAKGRSGPERLDAALAEYREVVADWNDNLNRVLALVRIYFGDEARNVLENRLHVEFVAIGEELEEFVREVSASDDVAVRPIGRRLRDLSDRIYHFDLYALGRITGETATDAPLDLGDTDLVRFGERSERVRPIQQALGIEADGHFGRRTERALRTFQQEAGLPVDGIVGPETRRALDHR